MSGSLPATCSWGLHYAATPSVRSLLSLTTVLGEDVRQVTGPVDEALSHGGRAVVSTVYRELRAFFGRVDRWQGESGSGEGDNDMVEPMRLMGGLLLRERDAVESIRLGRAEAVLAFLRLPRGVRGVPDGLGEALHGWKSGERAGAVLRILEEIQQILQ